MEINDKNEYLILFLFFFVFFPTTKNISYDQLVSLQELQLNLREKAKESRSTVSQVEKLK